MIGSTLQGKICLDGDLDDGLGDGPSGGLDDGPSGGLHDGLHGVLGDGLDMNSERCVLPMTGSTLHGKTI